MDASRFTEDVTPLRRGHVEFTPLQMENIHTHFRWNNDPELNRLDSEVPYREEAFGEFKSRFERLRQNPSPAHQHFEIHALDADSTLIGVAFVAHISEHNRHGQVGITIGDRDFRGQGYGRKSLRLLLAYCFERLGLHRVRAETFEYHEAWRRLVEGMGFVKEGTARESLYRDGKYWDIETYSLLEQEYRARHAEAENDKPVRETA